MKKGFTLVETLVYIVIAALLLGVITVLVMNIFNSRRQLIASYKIQQDARFIHSFLNYQIHGTSNIEDVSPALEGYHFFQGDSTRYSFEQLEDNLIYRVVNDSGSGFPSQSTGEPVILNSSNVKVSDWSLQGLEDYLGNENQGILVSFTLSHGSTSEPITHISKSFKTFFSLR